jgi:hypothetical protein
VKAWELDAIYHAIHALNTGPADRTISEASEVVAGAIAHGPESFRTEEIRDALEDAGYESADIADLIETITGIEVVR